MSLQLIVQSWRSDDQQAAKAAVREALAAPGVSRIVVKPRVAERVAPTIADEADAFFAHILAALMIAERLDIEVAFASAEATTATARYGLPHGPAALELADHGVAQSVPLIRDDAATVLVGRARHLGESGAKVHGETYVDSERLFDGEVRGVRIEPTPEEPGVRARLERAVLPGRWVGGRAVQTGGTNLVVEREGIVNPRVVKRSTFYRHHVDLRLVRTP